MDEGKAAVQAEAAKRLDLSHLVLNAKLHPEFAVEQFLALVQQLAAIQHSVGRDRLMRLLIEEPTLLGLELVVLEALQRE